MELDDLKKEWKQTSNTQQPLKKDIMELIKQPQYGPVALLKKGFRKQIALITVAMAVIGITTIKDGSDLRYNFIFWSYMAFCLGIILFHFMNYRIARRMEIMTGDVRSNLQEQISSLETRLKWKRIFLPLATLFFIALLEIVPYYQDYRMLDKWHALPAATRIGSYAGFLVIQFFANGHIMKQKFGNHLQYLKKVIKDME